VGIISLMFNQPNGGRFNNIQFGHAEGIRYLYEFLAKRNTLIKVVDVSTGGGLQKQQSTSQGGGEWVRALLISLLSSGT